MVGLITKAKANNSERKRQALARWERGDADFEDLLEAEWEASEVQEELQGIVARYRSNSLRLEQKHRELQKKVYDRVRWWFPEPKPRVKVRGQWRSRLGMPVEVNAAGDNRS